VDTTRGNEFSILFLKYSHIGGGGGVESKLGPLCTPTTNWSIVPSPGDCEDGELVEWRLVGETEVLGENLPQRHFVHHKFHFTRPVLEPWPRRWETSD
jgi:hypothetical protein